MSQNERTGVRDLLYSRWHRSASISRFIGLKVAAIIKTVDIDWCEACHWCDEPVALIETQRSQRGPKRASVTQKLAERAKMPAYSVAYEPSADGADISGFTVRQIAPYEGDVRRMLPPDYAFWLVSLRNDHNEVSRDCKTKTLRLMQDR